MKNILILIGLILLVGISHSQICDQTEITDNTLKLRKAEDRWIAKDKAKHFLASFYLTGATIYYFHHHEDFEKQKSVQWGIGCSLVLGLAKEINDQRRPKGTFSWKDLIVDILGIVFGWVVLGGW